MSRTKFTSLILEDDANIAKAVAKLIEAQGGDFVICASVAEAGKRIKGQPFHLLVLDNYLPDGKGQSFFLDLRKQGVYTPCIMLTGVPEIKTAVELTRDGLFEYLIKPLDTNLFCACVQRVLSKYQATESAQSCPGVVANSSAMKQVYRLALQAAANRETTILLTGETGVGKEVAARLIHQLTFQGAQVPPMVCLNCSAVPSDMFEAELFGAEKGAYTGAQRDRIGLAEAAKGGTLFLDEIGEIPLLQQAKLLRFLESREFRRLGNPRTLSFDGRIIAATNKVLDLEVKAERFREDLLYRLNVFSIEIPPLRERKEDIPALVEVLTDSICKKSKRQKPTIREQDLDALRDYNFPGNVRELRNIIERALIQTEPTANWLQLSIPSPKPSGNFSQTPSIESGVTDPTLGLTPFEKQEYILIRDALRSENGKIRRAASRLKISHQALLRRLEKWPELRNDQGTASM